MSQQYGRVDSMSRSVLLIDDDVELGQLIEIILNPVGVTVEQAYSGLEGLKKFYEIRPDLVILDVNMPGMNGFEVCSRLRELSSVPILMLTARTNDSDLLRGFNLGVDDYVKKPFNRNELEARSRALLRRSTNNSQKQLYVDSYIDSVLEIDLAAETVRLLGRVVELSRREYTLLACLVRNQDTVVPHSELIREVLGEYQINATSTLSFYICYLRKKLEDGQHGHEYIHTNWGLGYWFEARKEEKVASVRGN